MPLNAGSVPSRYLGPIPRPLLTQTQDRAQLLIGISGRVIPGQNRLTAMLFPEAWPLSCTSCRERPLSLALGVSYGTWVFARPELKGPQIADMSEIYLGVWSQMGGFHILNKIAWKKCNSRWESEYVDTFSVCEDGGDCLCPRRWLPRLLPAAEECTSPLLPFPLGSLTNPERLRTIKDCL